MPVSKSAKKRVRRNTTRTKINRTRRSRMRGFIRRVEEAIKTGDRQQALEAFKNAQPEIHRAASKGVVHLRTASRKLSRLSSRIKKLGAKKKSKK